MVWTTISLQTAGADGAFAILDDNAPNYPVRFYRVRDLGDAATATVANLQTCPARGGSATLAKFRLSVSPSCAWRGR